MRDDTIVAAALVDLAAVASLRGDHRRAVTLAGIARRLRGELGGGAPQPLVVQFDPVAAARAALDEAAIERLLADGGAMTREEANAYVRSATTR